MVQLKLFLIKLAAACAIIFLIVWYFTAQQNKVIQRLEDNLYQLNETNKYLELSQKEFKVMISKRTDSLLRLSGIKPKQVTEVTNVYHQYFNGDTNILINPILKPTKRFYFVDSSSCVKVKGYVLSNDTPFVAITEKRYSNTDTYIAFRTRGVKWYQVFKAAWWTKEGHREYIDLNVYSDCGQSKVERLKIETGD